jgi:hypothetical protein
MTGTGLAPTRDNHVCRTYDDDEQFRDAASAFLTEGIVAGERLEYLGAGRIDDVRRRVRRDPGLAMLLDGGHLSLRSLDAIYGVDDCVDGTATVAAYAAATQQALDGGYTGLRVVAEATQLVRTIAQREAFAHYEHLVDRYMVGHPFAALCGYDSRVLGLEAAAEIACLHPQVNPGAAAFRWFALADGAACLAGEVDLRSRATFDTTLARTLPIHAGSDLMVDARALAFIDHRGLLALEEHALRQGITVLLRADSPVLHKMARLLRLQSVRMEGVG